MAKMAEGDWSGLEHFTVDENWGDPFKMDRDLLYLLEYLRILFKHPIVIHCGYQYRPKRPTSQHNDGTAADGHVKGMSFRDTVDLLLQILETLTVGEVRRLFPEFMVGKYNKVLISYIIGLGIYPHWNSPGIHIDTRGHEARWGAVNRNGEQVYVSFEEAYEVI